jgi:hypothetical protein
MPGSSTQERPRVHRLTDIEPQVTIIIQIQNFIYIILYEYKYIILSKSIK